MKCYFWKLKLANSVEVVVVRAQNVSFMVLFSRVPTDLESQVINLVSESPGILYVSEKNGVLRPSCLTVVYVC